MQFEPGRKEAWAKVIDDFNAQSKSVEVEFVGWPFAEYSNQMLTQVQAGGLEADLITAPPDLASRLFALDAFDPMTEAIDAAGVTPDPGLHKFVTKDGKIYGVSVVTVSFGLLYNQAVLGAAGLEPATNVDDWVAQAAELTRRPDSFGLIAANTMAEQANWWFQLQNWVNAYDGTWAEGKTPLVTSGPVVKTLELYKRMYEGAIPQGSNDAQQMELMANGRGSQALLVSATVNVLKSTNPEVYKELRSIPAPWASKKGTARVHPISLYSGSRNKNAANEFLSWLLEPEHMADLTMESLDMLAPYPQLNEVPAFETYLKDLPWVEGYMGIDPVTPMDLMGDFINANDEFGNIVLSHFQSSLTGGVPVADAMGKAQAELEALAGRLG
ncbi:ABC transporter substrate-binding protein [Microbacterium sp. 179-I 3D3 NHS]|uniref:ABC transporter substrate-binding protein n=1 Tax=Microbacterium sp. 179-I 3D3 NHS TaxID=3142382 RepID=UPI00399F8C31